MVLRAVCCAILATYATLAIVPACAQANTNGFVAYYTASKILIDRSEELEHVYDNAWFRARTDQAGFTQIHDIYNTQPPTMSVMMAPFAWMPPVCARVVWVLFSVVLWIAGLGVLAKSLGLFEGRSAIDPLLVLSAMTTGYSPIRDNLRHGQCYTLLFFLLCLALLFALRQGPRSAYVAGIPLGLMLVFKTAGVWLWPLLLLSRRWRVLLGAVATALIAVFLASPWIGWSVWRAYFHEVPRLALDPSRYATAYQTLTSLMGHLFVFDSRWSPAPVVNASALSTLLEILVRGVVLVVSLRVQRLDSRDIGARTLSLGMLTSLIVTMAPVAEGYHYVLVLPALVIAIWDAAGARVGPRSWLVLATITLLLTLPLHYVAAPFLQTGWRVVFAYPRVFGAFLLWGWLVFVLATRRAPLEVSPESSSQVSALAADDPREVCRFHAGGRQRSRFKQTPVTLGAPRIRQVDGSTAGPLPVARLRESG
jgi:hypothetical protein